MNYKSPNRANPFALLPFIIFIAIYLGAVFPKGQPLLGMTKRYMDHLKSYISHLEGVEVLFSEK